MTAYDDAHMDVRKRRSPILRAAVLRQLAEEAIEEALGVVTLRVHRYGGHRHAGPGNPLLTELPLPSGWRKP